MPNAEKNQFLAEPRQIRLFKEDEEQIKKIAKRFRVDVVEVIRRLTDIGLDRFLNEDCQSTLLFPSRHVEDEVAVTDPKPEAPPSLGKPKNIVAR